MNMFDKSIYDKLLENSFDDTMSSRDMQNNKDDMHCNNRHMMYGCKVDAFPAETPLAMSYIPYQSWETLYSQDVALDRGTVFPSLDKPFIGEEAVPYGWKR